jgi:uncharacterized damage-inducible protein DinB
MDRSRLLAERAREVFLEGRWIANTNYKEQLTGTSWQAAIRHVEGLNSIALLTFHVRYYVAGLCQVLEGGPLEIRDKHSFNMPAIQDADGWQALLHDFLSNAERFVELVEAMPDLRMDEPFVDPQYGSYQRNLEAVVEHAYYHLGQIVLLRRMAER